MSDKYKSSIDPELLSKLGFSLYSPSMNVSEAASKCLSLGLAAYQISGDFQVNFPENIDRDTRGKIAEFNRANGLHIHYHAPGDIPLAGRHKSIRLVGVKRLTEFIELAIEIGAVSFIFHPGRFAYYKISSGQISLVDRKIPDVYLNRFLDSVYRLVDFAAGRINLLLENTYGFSNQIIETIDKFLELPATGLVWDIGHMDDKHVSREITKSEPNRIAEFISERLDYIKLAHVHDVAGNKGHLPLGTGSLDIASFIDLISRLKIEMIIEVLSEQGLQTSLDYLANLSVKKR